MKLSLLCVGGYVTGWALVMAIGWLREWREDRLWRRRRAQAATDGKTGGTT